MAPTCQKHPHHGVVLVGGFEVRRRPCARPSLPENAAPAGVSRVGVAIHRRVGGERQQQRQPRPQPVAHLDGGVPVGDGDVHMTSADALLVGDHAEPLRESAVARIVGDRELVRHRRRQPDGEQSRSVGLRRLRRDAPQPGQLGPQFLAGVGDVGRRLDLAAGQLELQLDSARGGVAGDRLIAGDRFAGVRVDEQELLLDADCGMAGHGSSKYGSGPSEASRRTGSRGGSSGSCTR